MLNSEYTIPRRPNRAHGAVDELPEEMRLLIKDLYLDGKTYTKIVDRLSEEGYRLSRSQVHRWISRKRNELERIEIAREKAAVLVKYLCPDGGDIEKSAVGLAQAIALEALADAKPMQVGSIEDLAKISNSMGRLQSSKVQREKWEADRRKLIEAAMVELKAEAQKLLSGQPELEREILDLLARAQEQMT